MKNKKALIAIGALAVSALIGGSVAYFTTQASFDNEFHVSTFQSQTSESFTSPTNWKPCDVTPKVITVTNSGSIALGARVKLDDFWKDKNGNDLADLTKNGNKLTTINFHDGWENKWELRDGWYVYKTVLEPGASTEPLIDSVSLSCEANLTGAVVWSADGKTGETGNSDYAGAKFHVNATIQTIQADAISEWD